MKVSLHSPIRRCFTNAVAAIMAVVFTGKVGAIPATVIFQDDFNGGIPGWSLVVPAGANWQVSPNNMLWGFDAISKAFSEHSNIYSDSATYSTSRQTTMMINDTIAPTNFTYSARLIAADDDGFGLIWGYENESTFYRVTFCRQTSPNRGTIGWPYYGVVVDRMNNSAYTNLLGPDSSFVCTAGQPFDVTITVTNGNLQLTIVDNPLVSPVTNTFNTDVTPVPLPTVPQAKVGIFTWGMSGNVAGLRSFAIKDIQLSPTPLTGDPSSTVLSNWSFLITKREDGTDAVSATAPPFWGIGYDVNGNKGRLFENSDWTVDNVVAAYTNCPVPAAVAGDQGWSNYVYSARFYLHDDDGFGMFVRYQNETNFYRISFRSQSTAAGGIRRGISVQKNVNRVFDQMYSNSVAAVIPPVGGFFDVHAFIRSNTLQVITVRDPLGASPVSFASGPIDMGASTLATGNLDTGKIGLFSWAMFNVTVSTVAGMEVDYTKVSQVDGEGLIVSSAFGTPDPPNGLHDLPIGSTVTGVVDSIVVTAPGVRQTNNGWVGLGAVPASGTTNYVEFNLNAFSSLTWRWVTQYQLTTNANPGGTVTSTHGPWINANSTVTVTATPNPGYMFVGWSGSSVIVSNVLVFPMIRPVNLTASFAPDSDGDGLPDPWELEFFGNTLQGPAGDPDGDGKSNITEYLLGTNPNFAEALLVSDGLTSQWTNTSRDTGLMGEFTVVDFGAGYRGAFNNNNEFRYSDDTAFIPANNLSNNVSFQTHRMIVRSNVWNPNWGTNFCVSWECSVGDQDGECFYFRYLNESNWFRVTLCGENPQGSLVRPFAGMTVQRRTNGFHSDIPLTPVTGNSAAGIIDPLDGGGNPSGFKKVRVTVLATNQDFEVRVIGWNAFLGSPDFDPSFEYVTTFSNSSPSLQGGRIGFGNWGQGGFGPDNQINGIPIPNGGFFDNIVVRSPTTNDPVVFSEDFESAMIGTNLPPGWSNPYQNDLILAGNWVVNVDGAISQLANSGPVGTGTATNPKADMDAPLLIAPDQVSRDYYLQVGFQQFDNDGVGVVYDFVDTNNYSRAMFRQEATFAGDIPPGLSVSRKSGGVWTDIVAGDPAFIYTPGRPFELTLANNSGDYTLVVRDLDNPAIPVRKWHWTAPPAAQTNRFGITTWSSQSAHLLYAKAFSLPHVPNPFSITNVAVSGGNVALGIAKQPGDKYHVLRASVITGPWVTNALNQTSSQYSEPVAGDTGFYRLQYAP